MILTCQECGKEFKTSDRRRKYCSVTCGTSIRNKKSPNRLGTGKNKITVTDEEFAEIVKDVRSIAGLLKRLNLKPWGANYYSMKKKLQLLELDTSHWTGQGWSRDQQLKDWSQYNRAAQMKPHLVKIRGHKCESCNLDEWLDKPITLEIHHIDGDRTNNNPDNLQLLCPNCHSYTDNWKSRNIKKAS